MPKKFLIGNTKSVGEGLQKLYREILLPLENQYHYHELLQPKLDDSDFIGPPIIMFIGQYSTGKTTFIKYLLGEEFPGLHIGPEPTTDKFIALMHGDQPRTIPGNTATIDPSRPFRALSSFGNNFLNRFMISETPNDLLKAVTIIDTPGVLSGTKQTEARGYDFISIIKYLGEKADRIYLLVDAHKLDISDEFRDVILALQSFDCKIRFILNKADRVDYQQLMRVYGALMWSLGKVLQTPEVKRVFIGSFWDEPYFYDDYKKLFESEEQDLMQDMRDLPCNCMIRRFNDFITRARSAKTLFLILSEISKQMPVFFKDSKKTKILENLQSVYNIIQNNYNIATGDFPDIALLKKRLETHDLSKFPILKKSSLESLNNMLEVHLPKLHEMIPQDTLLTKTSSPLVGGVFTTINKDKESSINGNHFNPFEPKAEEKELLGINSEGWPVSKYMDEYREIFLTLEPENDKLNGDVVRKYLTESKLSNLILMKIWNQSDLDKDGKLDLNEFALCNYLIKLHLSGINVPSELPPTLLPPKN